MATADDEELFALFEQGPLLLRAEVLEQAKLEEWIAQGRVGCRVLTPGVKESQVYWIKRTKAGDGVVECTPTKSNRTRSRFVSPLVHVPLSKHPRLHNTVAPPTKCSGEGRRVEPEQLVREKKLLESKLKEKEGRLSKLRLVKLYRSKNDLPQLDQLVSKWRRVSQEAADMLLSKSCRDPAPTMTQLLDYLHIDQSLIRYSPEQDSFY